MISTSGIERINEMAKYIYTMWVYKVWDGELLRKSGSNNLAYFDKYKGSNNYRIVIKQGNKIIYDER